MDRQATVSRKRKAPPVDPNNSEAVRLAHIAERKKQRLAEAAPKKGKSLRAASVEDVEDIDTIHSTHCANPRNPNTIIKSSEAHITEQKKQLAEAAPTTKKGKSSRAASVEDVEDIDMVHSSHRERPKNPNTIIESSEGEDEVDVPAPTQRRRRRVPEVPKNGKSRAVSRMLRTLTRFIPLTVRSPRIPPQLSSPRRVKTRLISRNLRNRPRVPKPS